MVIILIIPLSKTKAYNLALIGVSILLYLLFFANAKDTATGQFVMK
jgi:hypothetical protein